MFVSLTWAAVLHLNVVAERDIRGSAGLQGDRVAVEVLQHVHHVLEPQVVHMTLAPGVHGETQVLREHTHTHTHRSVPQAQVSRDTTRYHTRHTA